MEPEALPSAPEAELTFPHAPCKKGTAYVTNTPYKNEDGSDHQVAMMDARDWLTFGTMLETLRRVAKAQDDKIRELHADVGARDKRYADILSRMEALREVRRAEKRAELTTALGITDNGEPITSFKPQGT